MFTEDDIDYALAWQEIQGDCCPGCGHPKSESFSPQNAKAYQAVEMRCHACATREDAAVAIGEDETVDKHGLFLSVTRRKS